MDGFYVTSNLPEVFRVADEMVARERNIPEYVREPEVIEMPSIDSNPNIDGPMHITREWYDKKKAKRQKKREREKKDMEVEMIQLVARRDMLKHKLNELDPGKKKDSKKIADINIQLKTIASDLQMLETQSGIHVEDLENGTKLGRFVERTKKRVRKTFKRIRKFCKRNSELIMGVCTVALPVIGTFLGRLIFKN